MTLKRVVRKGSGREYMTWLGVRVGVGVGVRARARARVRVRVRARTGSGAGFTLSSALDEDCGMCMMSASGYCTAPGTRQGWCERDARVSKLGVVESEQVLAGRLVWKRERQGE